VNPHALLVSDVYFPRVNGVSTSIHTFCADLAEIGVRTTLVAPAYDKPDEAAKDEGGTPRVLRVPARPVPRDPEDRLMSWRALNAALRARPPVPYDVVHVHTPFLAHYAGQRAARDWGVPLVATCHTYFEDYLHHYLPLLPHALGRSLARRFTRSQFEHVDAVIAPTQPLLEALRGYGVQAPIHVIPTGMPADRFVRGDGARFRREHGIEPQRPVVLILGRVAFEKNLSFLLRMFVRVRQRVPEALLVVAGEGPARASLEREAGTLGIAAATRFVGNLDRERGLSDCYAAADAFVFASRTETQGLTLLEAMAQGTPVVSTACLGTRSVLGADCGARVVAEDAEDFAVAVADVLAHPAQARELSVQGVTWARRWSSRGMAWRLAELYAELADSRRRSPVAVRATA
jgi:glycosyltransferase involved in cell wall biosynthesis